MEEKKETPMLWDRLKSSHKTELEVSSHYYPFTVNSVREELQKTKFVQDLTFETVSSLCIHTTNSDANKIYDIFDLKK
jgi:hypothetical protein